MGPPVPRIVLTPPLHHHNHPPERLQAIHAENALFDAMACGSSSSSSARHPVLHAGLLLQAPVVATPGCAAAADKDREISRLRLLVRSLEADGAMLRDQLSRTEAALERATAAAATGGGMTPATTAGGGGSPAFRTPFGCSDENASSSPATVFFTPQTGWMTPMSCAGRKYVRVHPRTR